MKRWRTGPADIRLMVAAGVWSAWALGRVHARRAFDLRGKTVLITGGSRGLGLVLARQVLTEGGLVAICAREHETLDRARELLETPGSEVLAVPCDVTDRASVQQMLDTVRQHFGPVDVLINNAGVIEVGPAETMSVADYDEAMATNFWGMLYPTLAVLPGMKERRTGRIVNITSIGGKLGLPHLLPYTASKFAAVGFSQGLRVEVAPYGVKVVTVVPGLMRTGSPRNAIFRGKHRSEYAWFSISDSLPGLSVSAESAARRIIAACRRGDAEALFPIPARIAAVINAVAPGLTSQVLTLVERLLPGPSDQPRGRRMGSESQSRFSPSWLTRLGDSAARKYNQIAPAGGASK